MMIQRISLLSAATLLAAITVGCGGQTDQQLGGMPSPTLTTMDNNYLRDITESNMTEIQSSQMALQDSNNDQIKQFAHWMINSHTSAETTVAAVAKSKGAVLPTLLDNDHKDMLKELDGKTGADFDKAYIDLQIKAHEATINFNRNEADNGQDPDVKDLAESLRQTLQSHLDAAKALKQKMMSM